MKDWASKYPFNDYVSALAHLDRRDKRVRFDAPIGNRLRLVKNHAGPGSVSVIYHQTPIVTYWADGSQVLNWGGWFTGTTFRHIEAFARLGDIVMRPHGRVRNGGGDGVEFWRTRDSWPRTPAKVRTCRACKGTGMSKHGPSDWHDGTCWRCKGATTVDYGSKIVPEVFDGTFYLLIDADGTYSVHWDVGLPSYDCKCSVCQCGCENWQEHYSQHVVPKKKLQPPHFDIFAGAGGSTTATEWASFEVASAGLMIGGAVQATQTAAPSFELSHKVADELSAILPGMNARLNCPRCTNANERELSDLIVHLNDVHRVTREEVADWLETLDLDLTFPVPA